jgi:polyphosphate kinase
MERNLDRRVETAFPITGKRLQARVCGMLQLYLDDNVSAWLMQPDGSYVHATPVEGDEMHDVQAELLARFSSAVEDGGAA